MNQNPLVTAEQAKRFLAELEKEFSVQCAFWVKESDKEDADLYVAASDVTDENIDVAYGKVLDTMQRLGDAAIDPFRVKLLAADDPLAKAATELRRRLAIRTAVAYHGRTFGDLNVDWVLVYDLPVSAPAA